jgi:hypothetical protein
VPTTRPRHTITETQPVHEALDELRAKLNGDRIDFAELVILGARAKARRLPDRGDAEKARKARKELAKWIRNGNPGMVDIKAAEGLEVGDRLELIEKDGRLTVTKAVSGNPVAAVYGILGAGGCTDETIRALRGLPDAV